MLMSNAKTWTIVLILYIVPKCTFSAAIASREMTSKTLFEALAAKFPHIEITNLRIALDDIFTSHCNNWTTIEHAKPIYQDKNYVPCRLLYESLDSFLTKIGKQFVLSKSFVDTIMTGNYTLQDICLYNKSFSSQSSVLSTKEGLSDYLNPSLCLLSCIDTSKLSTNQSINTCKAAYFFATFDISKFMASSKSSLKISESQPDQENKGPLLKESKNQASASEGESKIQHNQLPVPTEAEVQEPKHTFTNEKSLGHPQSGEQPLASDPNGKTVQGEIMNKVSVNKVQGNGLSRDESKIENGHDSTEESLGHGAVASDTKPEAKVLGKSEALQEQPSPIIPAKYLPNADKTPVESDNNNDRENQEESSLDNDNGKQAYSSVTGDESDNAKQDENVKPDLPQQTEPKKLASKKLKPNTLDADEPVSSNNIVDDDMDGDSYFFSYFTVLMCIVIVGYVGYHNRQKVLALLLEGKRGKRNGRNARRPNSANYHKLDSNLEEAMSSSCTKNASNIIY